MKMNSNFVQIITPTKGKGSMQPKTIYIGKYSGRAKDFCGEALRKILYYNHHL